MLSINTRQAYSEIDAFLELLSEEQQNEVPKKLREFFKKEKDTNYKKVIDKNIPIKEQNLKEETLALIAMLNLQYWCKNEAEKQRLNKVYSRNEFKYQEKIREKYNPDSIFKDKEINSDEILKENVAMVEYKKENIFVKLNKFIKKCLNKKENQDVRKKEIENELAQWGNNDFLETVNKELCDYVNNLDGIIYKRYYNIIENLPLNLRERALATLKSRNLIDDNMNYIGQSNIVKFDKDSTVSNGGYIKGEIIVNPNSAKQFYDAYLDFLNGKTEGIRNIDYSQPLDKMEELSSLETLYWYYYNGKTYQDFLKSTMLHEDVHRWTLNGDIGLIDDKKDIFAMEGFVEREARDIAKENGIEYAKCFRNDEIFLIDYLGKANEPTDNVMSMLYFGDSANCLYFAIKMMAFKEIKGISPERAGELAKDIYIELGNIKFDNKNSFGTNYREILSQTKPDKSYKIIAIIENTIAKEQLEQGTSSVIDSAISATEESTKTSQINEQVSAIKKEMEQEKNQSEKVNNFDENKEK